MEGQSDKASGTGHDAAVRTAGRGLPDRLPVRWLLPPLKPMPNRSRSRRIGQSVRSGRSGDPSQGEAAGHHVSLRDGRAAGSRCFEDSGRDRAEAGACSGSAATATAGKKQDDAAAPQLETLLEKMDEPKKSVTSQMPEPQSETSESDSVAAEISEQADNAADADASVAASQKTGVAETTSAKTDAPKYPFAAEPEPVLGEVLGGDVHSWPTRSPRRRTWLPKSCARSGSPT